ncbi:MAG TPA: HD domain-containing phosphohydrolase, partial [Leptolinea sp.]
ERNESQKMEYRIHRSDGEQRDLSVKVDWLPEGKNPKRYLIGSIQDVTEKNRAFFEIHLSEEKFRQTVQQMSDGLVLLDENGTILEWNSAHARITEISAKDAIGKNISEFFPLVGISDKYGLKIENFKAGLVQAIETGKSEGFNTPFEISISTRTGQIRTVLQTIFPIMTTNQLRIGILTHDITEQKASLDKINHEMQKLASLRSIDAAILERITAEKTLSLVSSIAVDLLNVDGAIILARTSKDDITQVFNSRIDTPEEPLIAQLLELLRAAIDKFNLTSFSNADLEMVDQIHQIDPVTGKTLNQAVQPLIMNKKVCGYIQVFSRNPIPTDQEWMDYFLTLAGQTSLAIESVTLITNEEIAYSELNQAYEATIAGWSKALELRDEETKGHSDRVMYLASQLAREAGYPEEKMTSFRRGVLLHDIGKMGIPDRILLKPGKLTEEEWKIMRLHPGFANDLLSAIPYLNDSLDVPYSHHEHWDGSGYPRGLKGKEIPLAARIFTIVDVWDALLSDRPYRDGWEPKKIKNYIIENKALLFDPDLVDLFIKMLEKRNLDFS